MNKSMIIALIVFVAVIVGGILEIKFVGMEFEAFSQMIDEYSALAKKDALTKDHADALMSEWRHLREISEMFLPHIDSYELGLRVAECCCNIELGEMDLVRTQLCIIATLTEYVPGLMRPDIQHIF